MTFDEAKELLESRKIEVNIDGSATKTFSSGATIYEPMWVQNYGSEAKVKNYGLDSLTPISKEEFEAIGIILNEIRKS